MNDCWVAARGGQQGAWQPHSPKRSHAGPTLPPVHKLHDDGHRSQVDGHIGSCAQTGREPVGDDAKGSRGRGGGESWSRLVGATVSAAPVPCLGAHHCLHLFRHPSEQVLPVSFLHPGTGFVLPTRSPEWWSCPRNCCFPTGRVKSHDTSELTTRHLCGLKETCLRLVLQLSDHCLATLGCSHDKQIATQCHPKQKAWKAVPTTSSPRSGDMWRILHRLRLVRLVLPLKKMKIRTNLLAIQSSPQSRGPELRASVGDPDGPTESFVAFTRWSALFRSYHPHAIDKVSRIDSQFSVALLASSPSASLPHCSFLPMWRSP